MKVYIAGPMTGHEYYNLHAFERAARHWRLQGHEVETPFDANSRVWRRHHGRDFDPTTDTCEYGDPILREMFAEDVAVLCGSDAVVMLDGWRDSRGASMEKALADLMGIPTWDVHGEPVDKPGKPAPPPETVLQAAQRLVHGDRGASYGHPIDDYTSTGRIWAATLDRWLRKQPGFEDVPPLPDIDPRIAALMMVGVKLSREAHKPKRDNRTDMAGYAECVDMIAERQA